MIGAYDLEGFAPQEGGRGERTALGEWGGL